MDKIGIYIHIPFCLKKCLYCDFASYAGLENLYFAYADALCMEIAAKSAGFSDTLVDTIYFGGGTPGILPVELIKKIKNALEDYFRLAAGAEFEFTIETNPGSVSYEKLKQFKELSVNRLSLGIQSFDDELLQRMGRRHSALEGEAAVRLARDAAFANISIDLMYGLPGQTLGHLCQSLEKAAGIGATHISVYGLKIEAGTPFAKMMADGVLSLPDAELEEKMYDLTIDYLSSFSFLRYEISNFAKPDFMCRHNLKYWRYLPYLGIGAAAHSFTGGIRSENTADVEEYIRRIKNGDFSPRWVDEITLKDKKAEFIFLALRTSRGLDCKLFRDYFRSDFQKEYGGIVEDLDTLGLMQNDGDRLFLTRMGMKFSNQVFQRFLPG